MGCWRGPRARNSFFIDAPISPKPAKEYALPRHAPRAPDASDCLGGLLLPAFQPHLLPKAGLSPDLARTPANLKIMRELLGRHARVDHSFFDFHLTDNLRNVVI